MKITKKLDKKNKTLNVKVDLEPSDEKIRVNAQKVFNFVMEDANLAKDITLTSVLKNDTIVSNPSKSVSGEWSFSVSLKQESKKTVRASKTPPKKNSVEEE